MDAVQAANSGHPGTPMAMAPVVYCLWQRFLRFDPQDPIWPNRDRFVLSVGHASMLLYSMLHLCGVKAVNPKYEILGELSVMLDDIKRFRQLDLGIGTDAGGDDLMARRAAGRALSRVLGDRAVANLPVDMRPEFGAGLTVEVEVAGRFVPIRE